MQVTFSQHFKLNGKLLLYQQTKQLKYTVSQVKWSKEIKNLVVKGVCVEYIKIIWDLHHKHRQNKHPHRRSLNPNEAPLQKVKEDALKESSK